MSAVLIIVTAFHGHMTGLWKCRIWFCFPLVVISLRNATEYLVEKYSPFRTPMYDLKPKATWEGFIAGILTALAFNFTVG
jgi:CDP-diglyceride synthetase